MCPCRGKYGPTWHKNHKVPHCEQSSARKKAHHRNSKGGELKWTPGTSILVPEYEAP